MTSLRPQRSINNTRAFMLLLLAILSFPVSAIGATSEFFTSTPVTARLVTAENGVSPQASSISAGLELNLAEGWKTYWRSPGEVGIPPSINWEASTNISEVEFLWPAPKRFRAFGIENFGYQGTVVFPLRIVLENPGQPAQLSAAVNLLICSSICIPQDFLLTLDLQQGTGIDAKSAGQISLFADKVPERDGASGIAISTATFSPDFTFLTVTARSLDGFQKPDIFPEFGSETAFGAPDIRLGEGGKLMWARLPILSLASTPPDLGITITDGLTAATFTPELTAKAPEPPFALEQIVPGISKLIWIILMAVLGGFILNVMPCVLPVLSIKLSSALKSKDQSQARIRGGFLMTALGVVAFMWGLAGATLVARQLGSSVGWGLQFQNTSFLVVMILILTVFAANTFGLFEINLPQSWQDKLSRADGVAHSKGSYSGDFFTGAFAAVLATPCSAPFLGTAIAFALSGGANRYFCHFYRSRNRIGDALSIDCRCTGPDQETAQARPLDALAQVCAWQFVGVDCHMVVLGAGGCGRNARHDGGCGCCWGWLSAFNPPPVHFSPLEEPDIDNAGFSILSCATNSSTRGQNSPDRCHRLAGF